MWAGAIYLGAGYLLTFHQFLLLALLLQHLAQRFAPLPQAGSAVAALLLPQWSLLSVSTQQEN
jgi:hypothetical protein